MAKKRKRHIRKSLLYIGTFLLLALIIALVVFFLTFNIKFIGKTSIHEDAKEYKTKSCLVFYPDSITGESKAKNICANNTIDSAIYDYALIPYGDYYLVSYNDGTKYYVDKSYNDLTISGITSENGKKIVSDYLRYSMKKDEIDEAYTYEFLNETYYKNIDLSNVTYKIDGTDIVAHFDKYNYDVHIPIKYMQDELGINLGFTSEYYEKPRYVSKDRKKICFTFDDGPDLSFTTSGQIVDELYKYDSSGTFFLLGNRIGEKQLTYLKESVEKGMEYGSHTQSHKDLTKLSSSDAASEILTPYNDLKNGFGYEMTLFRPPYGAINENVLNATNLKAILWNVDSLDWSYRNKYSHDEAVNVIYEKVLNDTDENDVVLFHDIYQISADAACKLIEHYIKEGYQIVSASELMNALDVNSKRFSGK